MVKGVSIKFKSFEETVPKLLQLIKLGEELKKHERIVLKVRLAKDATQGTNKAFIEEVIKFCNSQKSPGSVMYIAEGADGEDTMDLFEEQGYKQIAEQYGLSLVDLNRTQCDSIGSNEFVGFEEIMYPALLRDSFVISLPTILPDERTQFTGALANMLGAFPGRYYKGLFSSRKSRLNDVPVKYQIHDIITCRAPNLALVDASQRGTVLAGNPLEIDKQIAKLMNIEWRTISYLRMLDETSTAHQQAEEKAAVASQEH